MNYFSTNLEFLRQARNLTQAEIQSSIGIERTTWSNYERGKSFPNLSLFLEIVNYFDISADDLLKKDLSKSDYLVQLDAVKSKKKSPKTVQDKKEENNSENINLTALIESNKMLSKANMDLAENAVSLTRLLSSGVGQGSRIDAAAKQADLLESIAVGLSRDGYFQSSQEAALELYRLSSEYDNQVLPKNKKSV